MNRLVWSVAVVLALWVALVGGSLAWNLHLEKSQLHAQAKRAAQVTLNKDVGFRQWIRSRGGVYVPVSSDTPPNPWLSHIDYRDTVIADRPFTLINSSYATRQVMELTGERQGVSSRVTSLEPLRPQNAADRWEQEVLSSFEQTKSSEDYFEVVRDLSGRESLRGVRPFYIETSCLSCHGHQGYEVGDLRGAMSVRVDLDHFRKEVASGTAVLVTGHLLIGLFGLLGISWLYRQGRANLQNQLKLTELSQSLECRVKEEVSSRRKQEAMLIQQSKMAAMGEMIGAIAHQWRQPLNAMGILIQDLRDAYQHQELDGPYLDRAVGRSMKQLQFMSKTIDDFRNFFRPESHKAPFDVGEVIHEALGLLGAQFKHHEIAVSISAPDKPVICHGFANHFKQAILNILTNAKDAIEERTIRPGRIDIAIRCDDMEVGVEICDNAGGIDPALLERIFEPYYSTKGPDKGTGIGLYMARMIVQSHMGGTLKAENRDQGACFVMAVPAGDLVDR